MTSLPRLPEDSVILDIMKSGITTIPGIARKIYGTVPTESDWITAKGRVLARLNNLEKYGFVRRTDIKVQMGSGRNYARIWEVIE